MKVAIKFYILLFVLTLIFNCLCIYFIYGYSYKKPLFCLFFYRKPCVLWSFRHTGNSKKKKILNTRLIIDVIIRSRKQERH